MLELLLVIYIRDTRDLNAIPISLSSKEKGKQGKGIFRVTFYAIIFNARLYIVHFWSNATSHNYSVQFFAFYKFHL